MSADASRRRLVRAALIGCLLGSIVVSLSGCAPVGAPADELRSGLEGIPGVLAVDLRSTVTQNGLDPMRTAVHVVIELDEAHEVGIGDGAALDYLLRVAWALGPDRPSSAIFLGIDRSSDGEPAGFDPLAGATELGIAALASVVGIGSGVTREVAMVRLGEGADHESLRRLLDRLGSWPGAVPEPPPALVVIRSGTGSGPTRKPSEDPPVTIGLRGTAPATAHRPPTFPFTSWRTPWPADRSRSRRCSRASPTCDRSAPEASPTSSSTSRTCPAGWSRSRSSPSMR